MKVSHKNLGTVNKNAVNLETSKGTLEIIFSYKTPVIFSLNDAPYVVREDDWRQTTGKLLNEYQADKKARVSGEVFESMLEKALNSI